MRLLLLAALLGSCAAHPITRAEAESVLELQAACWNGGDLAGFVGSYWRGPELTFLGGSGLVRGPDDLLAGYQAHYPTPEARGRLRFELLEFRALGDGHGLALGRYELERAEPSRGWFSLLLARQEGKVVVLHDHSSEER